MPDPDLSPHDVVRRSPNDCHRELGSLRADPPINAIRGAQNSPALTWRQMLDAAGFANTIPVPDHNAGIYAAHILALRAAMDAALAAVQVPTFCLHGQSYLTNLDP